MRRRIAGFHPRVIAAVAGGALGLLGAVLLIQSGHPLSSLRSSHIFYTIALLPGSHVLGNLTETFTYTSELLALLPLSGALWAVALAVLAGRLRRSVRARWVTAGSIVAGTTLAVLVRIVGFPDIGPYDGARGLIFLAQIPGMVLLTVMDYEPLMYDGEVVNGLFHPGPVTLLHFALANVLLAAGFVRVARFTWQWIRMPMPPRSPVVER